MEFLCCGTFVFSVLLGLATSHLFWFFAEKNASVFHTKRITAWKAVCLSHVPPVLLISLQGGCLSEVGSIQKLHVVRRGGTFQKSISSYEYDVTVFPVTRMHFGFSLLLCLAMGKAAFSSKKETCGFLLCRNGQLSYSWSWLCPSTEPRGSFLHKGKSKTKKLCLACPSPHVTIQKSSFPLSQENAYCWNINIKSVICVNNCEDLQLFGIHSIWSLNSDCLNKKDSIGIVFSILLFLFHFLKQLNLHTS